MNCREGDLAIVMSSRDNPRNIGRIVRCIRLIEESEPIGGIAWKKYGEGATWLVQANRPLDWYGFQKKERAYADRLLRPIRPQSDDAKDSHELTLPAVPSLKVPQEA